MKSFFVHFFATVLGLFVFSLLIVCFVVFLAGLLMLFEKGPQMPEKAVLALDLSIPISDKPARRSLQDVMQQGALGEDIKEAIPLRTVLDSIESASNDDRIVGLYLTGQVPNVGYDSGWAALKEVRESLARFQESGKPIIAFESAYNEANYFVASLADHLYMNPFGTFEFNGLATQVMFFKNAFDKYGIDVQVTRVGKYKSAVEPYIQDRMSEENREQIEEYLNDITDVYLEAIASSRNVDLKKLHALMSDEGYFKAETGVTEGLLDKSVYFDDVLSELRELTGSRPGEELKDVISVAAYQKAMTPERHGSKNQIAVIYAEGEIVEGPNENEVGSDTLAQLLRKARNSESVKAVVLRVNSPGGSATASDVIQRETRLLKQQKPFVVSMGTVAASGGYWISAYADEILAWPNTITGSIGVFGMLPSVRRLLNDVGISVDVVRTADKADMTSIFRSKTEEELAVIQRLVDFFYNAFLTKVCEGRKLDRAVLEGIAQGRVWSGVEAHRLGLVDRLGGLYDAVDAAAERAGLGDDYSLVQYQKKIGFAEEILKSLGITPQSSPVESFRGLGLENLKKQIALLSDPKGVYARLPYDLVPR
jgi:protease-4